MNEGFCEMMCYMEPDCASYNLKKERDGNGKRKCELNNSTHEGHKDELKENSNYDYRGAEASITLRSSPDIKFFFWRFVLSLP